MAIRKALGYGRQALITILSAPFVALGTLLAFIVIAFGLSLKTVEVILPLSIGGEYIYSTGVGMLPEFYY